MPDGIFKILRGLGVWTYKQGFKVSAGDQIVVKITASILEDFHQRHVYQLQSHLYSSPMVTYLYCYIQTT